MSWDVITEILTSHPADIKVEEGFHKALLVGPQPGNRAASMTSIISKTISQLLWERDSDEQWRNHRKLFKILLREPSTRAFGGLLFEPAFHELCIRGATFKIHLMDRQQGSANYTFTNIRPRRQAGTKSGSKTLKLHRQVRFFFDEGENRITDLLPDNYYQPNTSNYPSIDSFVYDPKSRQISAFQVTLAEVHDLKLRGVNALRELAERHEIVDLRIRIIVVVLGGAQVALTIRRELYDSLPLQMYFLKVTENQLYPR